MEKTGASQRKTGGCDRKSLCPSLFVLFSVRTLTSELGFLTHVWLKCFSDTHAHTCSSTLKLGGGAMADDGWNELGTPRESSSRRRGIKDFVPTIKELEDKLSIMKDAEVKASTDDQNTRRLIDIKDTERPEQGQQPGCKVQHFV